MVADFPPDQGASAVVLQPLRLHPLLAETVVAVHRLAARWPERHARRLAAVGADGLEHLAWRALAVPPTATAAVPPAVAAPTARAVARARTTRRIPAATAAGTLPLRLAGAPAVGTAARV